MLEQQSFPPKKPLFPQPLPHPPQNKRIRIRKRQLLFPPSLPHPHPQFVAVKSLMLNLLKFLLTLNNMT